VCNVARESWKRYETLPETKNVMERDATIARDQKRSIKDAMRCQRSENVSHSPVVLLKPFL
jgi:hypothetical protein